MPPPELQIEKTLDIEDVRWPQVLEVLVKRFKLPFSEASTDVAGFLKRFRRPLNLYWYLHPRLLPADNRLLALVCELEGTDVIRLSHERHIHLLSLRLFYRQAIAFFPAFKRSDGEVGRAVPASEVKIFGFHLGIRTAFQLMALQSALVTFAVFLYVVVVGLLLYSIAVFLLFLKLPVHVTLAATNEAPIGLALLCFLVAAAAIFGRAMRNLGRLLIAALRRGK